MSIRCEGTAKLRILGTDETFEVNPEDLEWEHIDTEEKSMGAELYYSATFYFYSEKEGCEVRVEWDVWEYPIGTIECVNTECDGCEILEDFEIDSDSLEDDFDCYDYQLEAILSNTEFYRTFSDEISSLRLLNSLVVENSDALKTLKKQIFVSVVTCLETYLSDAFVNTVLSKQGYLRSFFSSFKEFETQKISLNKLFEHFDKAEEKAKEAMLNVTYHNLPKVSNMYKSTFNIDFPNFSNIHSYIETRHDLVHRNGKTKDGREIFVDEAMVGNIIREIEEFIDELDRKLKDKEHSEELKTLATDPEDFSIEF